MDSHITDFGLENKFHSNRPIKTMISLYEGNYMKLLASSVFFFIKHLPVWVLPIVISDTINTITAGATDSMQQIIKNIFLLIFLVLLNIPANVLYTRYISLAVREVEADIRMNLVKKLQILSISYHKHLQAGRIHSKILRDVESIAGLSRQFCMSIVPIIMNLVVALTITVSKNGSIALFFMLSIPGCFLIVSLFRKNIRIRNRAFRKDIEEMSATVSQMIDMVPLTRAHALEEIEIERVDHTLHKVKESAYHVDILNALFGASSWATFQVVQVICLLFTGYLAVRGEIEVGDIVLYQTYFTTILNQVSAAINIYPELIKGVEGLYSVGEILQAQDVEKHMGKKQVKEVEGHFEFKDVSFRYDDGDEMVLEKFNLEVQPGECIAFVGESGGGKTTLLNLIIGFMKPTVGQLLLDGQDLAKVDLKSYRQSIAVVPQNTVLFYGTIRENITYGLPSVSEEELEKILDAACLKEVIEKLPNGLDTPIGEHGDMLSGGQRQRIAIARALIRNPRVIILDEATSALDNQSEIHVQQAMKNLCKDRTTFIVAHRLSTIIEADRIVVVNEGRAVESGSYEELMERRGEFYKLAYSRIAN